MSHKSMITYMNEFYRKYQHFISVLILIEHYLSSLLYFIIPTPVTVQKLSLEYTGLQKFSMQSGYMTYQLQKTRQTQCDLYYGFLNIVSFIVIRIAMSIWHNKKTSWMKFCINPIHLKDRKNIQWIKCEEEIVFKYTDSNIQYKAVSKQIGNSLYIGFQQYIDNDILLSVTLYKDSNALLNCCWVKLCWLEIIDIQCVLLVYNLAAHILNITWIEFK